MICGSLGSCGVIGFTCILPRCRSVLAESLCSLERYLRVVGLIRGLRIHSLARWWSWSSLARTLGVIGLIRGNCAHSHAPWGSLGSAAVVGFPCAHPGSLLVHRGLLGLLAHTLGSLVSSWVVGFTRRSPDGRWVHPRSLGSLAFHGVFEFIRCGLIHSPTTWESLGSSGVVGFTRARPRGRWVHPRSLC